MKQITKLIFGSSLLIASTITFASNESGADNDGASQYENNDWSDTPWGRKKPPMNRNRNRSSMPWSGRNSPWGDDNPFWDSGSDMWRDWDTSKWGGNGMPWGGGSGMPWSDGNGIMPWGGGSGMPWSKDKKHKRNRANRGYARPYRGGYGNPYPGGGYRGNPYNAGPGYTPAPGTVPGY